MSIAALITWIITALGGAVLLGTWLSRGGLRARDASRFPPGLILGHFLLVVVAALGFTMVGRWRQDRAAAADRGSDAARPPEQHFPVAVVYLHGLLAVITLILVLLTALGVGS